MRRSCLLALPLAFVPTLPATAAAGLPSCVVRLTDAASGNAASCGTDGPPPMANTTFGVYRTVYVAVASGSVAVSLTCDFGVPVETTVTAPAERSFGRWGGNTCSLSLRALADGTSAAGLSFGGYAGALD